MTDHETERLSRLLHECPPDLPPRHDQALLARARAERMRRNRRAGYAAILAVAVVAVGVPVGLHLGSGADENPQTATAPTPITDCPVTQPVPRQQVPESLRGLGERWVGAEDLWIDLPGGAVSAGPTDLKFATYTLDEQGRMSDLHGPPTLTARRLDGPGSAAGDRQSQSSYATATGPNGRVMHFWPTTITVPTPGCWAFTETLGDTTVRFVVPIDPPTPKPEQLVPALGLPQGAADVLPRDIRSTHDGGLDPATSRLLGQSRYGKHWVALNDDNDICLITRLTPDVSGQAESKAAVTGSSCTPAEAFRQRGLYLGVGGEAVHATDAYLLPADVDEASLRAAVDRLDRQPDTNPELFYRAATPLLVIDAGAVPDSLTIARDDGRPDIVLQPSD